MPPGRATHLPTVRTYTISDCLDIVDLVAGRWARRIFRLHPRAAVHELAPEGFAVALDAAADIPLDLVEPAGEKGFLVRDQNGYWPTYWPSLDTAFYVAKSRQLIRLLPREGRDLNHWIAPPVASKPYSALPATRRHFAHLHPESATWAAGESRIRGHRLSFVVFHGAWPTTVDHLCLRKRCVNPLHLEDTSWRENNGRKSLTTLERQRLASAAAARYERNRIPLFAER
ncbi:hypothetical protein [Micromonospora maritima]|uniref:hypothetical protein n=1 Tax=Micromonospora maritima TaxID=986711 RepID=UPI00157D3D60|nr:hypothetical protein [Micromonospora maritima]